MTNARRLNKKLEPLLTVIKEPSLEFCSLTHTEGEFTVDKREKEFQIVRLQQVTESCKLIRPNPLRRYFVRRPLIAVDFVV